MLTRRHRVPRKGCGARRAPMAPVCHALAAAVVRRLLLPFLHKQHRLRLAANCDPVCGGEGPATRHSAVSPG